MVVSKYVYMYVLKLNINKYKNICTVACEVTTIIFPQKNWGFEYY